MNGRHFQNDLARSNSPATTEWWTALHKKAFGPNYIYSRLERDLERQKVGIDRVVSLTQCRTITLEEKTDYTTYQNIPLEVFSTSCDTFTTPGWIEKPLASTVFAYGFHKFNTAYYFSTPDLLKAWQTHKTEWLDRYGLRQVYASHAKVCPVPIHILLAATPNTRTITLN